MRRALPLVAMLVMGTASLATAQPAGRRPAPPPTSNAFDERGWVLLGEQTVSGNVDKDKITVGRDDGRFSKLTIRVVDSDLELLDFKIVFGDKSEYNPKVTQFFKEGARTRAIELPPSEQVIRQIEFKYRNLPGGGRAKMQVYGWRLGDAGGRPQPTPQPPRVDFDTKGWTLLGAREVDGNRDRDRIEVGRSEGKFTKMTIVVRDSDLEMIDFAVKFNKGKEWRPKLAHIFRENQRTHVLDFPGDARAIKYIEFRYRNLAGGGRAKVEVYAKAADGTGVINGTPLWNNEGWALLGEKTVNGRRPDKDRIAVGRDEGKFRQLTIVVTDSDLEMIDFKVAFARGPVFDPAIGQRVFREGTRTHVIDLPGDKRVIKSIDFAYRNLPGGGNAKIQVWGK